MSFWKKLQRSLSQPTKPVFSEDPLFNQPLMYSWILNHQLAIGPMPRRTFQWNQLEDVGFKTRFSCCYPQENVFAPIPSDWSSANIPLPDHRQQESLDIDKLRLALSTAEELVISSSPVYLHCFAGQERSSLLAVGLTAKFKKIDVFTALEWVRRCHPISSPIYEHLEMLEVILQNI
ncbi:MAG: hypothetical protein NTZ40_05595 [Cyanobacteria bacterium]|nr:hypothetical protein [Cyanobacteriota bacterium]